jgi:MFS family permease
MQAYIGEWFSPNFHEGRYLAALLMILATLILPAFIPRRLRAREILLLSATTLMALRSVRHIPIYVLVAAPILSAMVQAILRETGTVRVFETPPKPAPTQKIILNSCLLLAMLVFSVTHIRSVILGQATAETREYPKAAVDYLEKAQLTGPPLNHYNWGGYLIWKLYPTQRVFIDGRADVYGDAFLDSFAYSYFLRGQAWDSPIQDWHIQTILLPSDAPLIVALRTESGWRTLFEDKQAVVLVKEK